MDTDYYQDLIRPVFADKKIIIALGVIAATTKIAQNLREELGAQACLIVGAGEGTGELPDPEELPWVVAVDEEPDNFLEGIRNYEAALGDPPPAVTAAIKAFDPHREALVLCSHVSDVDNLLGRPRLGPRRPAWAAYEDKVVIDAFWQRAGIDHAPHRICDVHDLKACRQAAAALDRGHGVVLAGDAKEGFNGGAHYIRHCRQPAQLTEALSFFEAHCDQVRLMPYLEGIPCSIHGIVFADQTIAFRPVEMIVFGRPDHLGFLYAGTGTWWDPAADDRRAMQQVARLAGDQLRREVDYRGAFTVDGVVTAQGFLPTELNPRSGGAFGDLSAGDRRLPLSLLDMCIRHGLDLDYRPQQLQSFVTALADNHRTGTGRVVVNRSFAKTETHGLVVDQNTLRFADDDDPTHITLTTGPSEVGGFLRVKPDDDFMTKGSSMAPLVGDVLAFADRHFETNLGELVAPTAG